MGKHVDKIQVLVDQGDFSGAETALAQLLALGPQNIDGLKLRASLFASQGRFEEEAQVWDQIAKIDNEDDDTVEHYQARHVEEREHFFFTDDTGDGGKRYLAYPRNLIRISFLGLLGCGAFLATSRLSINYPILQNAYVILPVFAVFVLIPWFWIIYAYVKSLRYIAINRDNVEVATRFKSHKLEWKDIGEAYVAHGPNNKGSSLCLLLIPKEQHRPAFEIDLTADRTPIRARLYFLRDLGRFFQHPKHIKRDDINNLAHRRMISF